MVPERGPGGLHRGKMEGQCFQEIHTSLLGQNEALEASIQLLHPSVVLLSVDVRLLGSLAAEGTRASSWWFFWCFSTFLNHHVITIRVGW